MKVAFTSSTGEMIDRHFGQTDSFRIWDITAETAQFLETLPVPTVGEDEEDRIGARADILTGCAIVYTMQIGGPAAAKLVARRIQPMKTTTEEPVRDVVDKLQQVLKGNPPPWLKKALQKESGSSFLDD